MHDRRGVRWLAIGLVLALVTGAVGYTTDALTTRHGWHFPSFGYFAGEIVWKLTTLGVMLVAIRLVEHHSFNSVMVGLKRDPVETTSARSRAPRALLGLVGAGALAVVVSRLFHVSASNASAYGAVRHVGVGLAVAEIAVRYPLTVLAEETLFRGWLQPRLPMGPVASSVLWGAYHLQQVRTIPSLIPLGIGLGVIRWWTGDVRASGIVHYLSNVAFFVGNYV